jgi:hypothetical protein
MIMDTTPKRLCSNRIRMLNAITGYESEPVQSSSHPQSTIRFNLILVFFFQIASTMSFAVQNLYLSGISSIWLLQPSDSHFPRPSLTSVTLH